MFEKRALLYADLSSCDSHPGMACSSSSSAWAWRNGRALCREFHRVAHAGRSGRRAYRLPERTVARDLLRFGVPLIPSSFFFSSFSRNQYLLERFGLGEVGIVIGFNFGLVMNLLASAFRAPIPHFMSYMDRPSEARDILSKVVTLHPRGRHDQPSFLCGGPAGSLSTQPPLSRGIPHDRLTARRFLSGLFMVLLPPLLSQT